MKICIFGAGSIGGYLGVQLAHAGFDVSVVARRKNLDEIRSKGLTLEIGGEVRNVRVKASDRPAELGPQDFVIVALKSHQAWEAVEHFKPLLGPETAVVTAQNGVP